LKSRPHWSEWTGPAISIDYYYVNRTENEEEIQNELISEKVKAKKSNKKEVAMGIKASIELKSLIAGLVFPVLVSLGNPTLPSEAWSF
jgi:hypothetical protein